MKQIAVMLLASALATPGCGFSEPSLREPHARVRVMFAGTGGNYLKARVEFDGGEVPQRLLAEGEFRVAPGPQSLAIGLVSGNRSFGTVRNQHGSARVNAYSDIRRCKAEYAVDVQAGFEYSLQIGFSYNRKACTLHCSRAEIRGDGVAPDPKECRVQLNSD